MTDHTPRSRLLRNSRSLKRVDDIVDAAARVFAERGYHGTSTQAIADVLGMRQASLYYYFSSKETALEIVCDKGVAGFLERAESIVALEEQPLRRLEKLIQSHMMPVETKADYVRVFINERRYLPASALKRIGRKSRAIERCFIQVIEAGMADGSIRTDLVPRKTMLLLLGMCNSVINWPAADREQVEATARDIAQLAVRGLRSGGRG